MPVTIRIFGAGEQEPRFIGTLNVVATGASKARRSTLLNTEDLKLFSTELNTEDLKLLWLVERAINNHVAGRCHIDVTA